MNKIIKFRFLGIAAFLAVIAVFSVLVMLLWRKKRIFCILAGNFPVCMIFLTRKAVGVAWADRHYLSETEPRP
ncbi:MAG: hypothetical protein Pg6A_02100 [Termitinemataceae bacterium]|nr:MAG: hypothetical protein Pg6A_02100 [Termitinemataceae bacterium]